MGGQTDGGYQVHYLPRFAVDKESDETVPSQYFVIYISPLLDPLVHIFTIKT